MHATDVEYAAVDACLTCHNDQHSVEYVESHHHTLWEKELAGELPPGSGVSCATCHMPREVSDVGGEIIVSVNHNQNANLQPNERMVRTTCLNCHGLEYSLNSLADPHVIDHGVQGRPSVQIQSLDWVRDRLGDIDPNRFGAFGE